MKSTSLFVIIFAFAGYLGFGLYDWIKKDIASEVPSPEHEQTAPSVPPTEAQKALQTIKVKAGDWDAVNDRVRELEAKLRAAEGRLGEEARARQSETEASCLKKINDARDAAYATLAEDMAKVVDELKEKIQIYQMPAAIVIGTCEGQTKNGEVYEYQIPSPQCLTVPNKKVGRNGEITMIEGISPSTAKEGLVKLSCYQGRARIKARMTPCER